MDGRGGDRRHSEERDDICFAFFSMFLTTLYAIATGSTSYLNARQLFVKWLTPENHLVNKANLVQFFLSKFINLFMLQATTMTDHLIPRLIFFFLL
jgi:hypothetical protein